MSEKAYRFTSTRATRAHIWLRAAVCGAGGSGKTYSAMAIASALRERLNVGPLYVIDSENESALRYARSARSGKGFDFMHVPMPKDDYSPAAYMAALDYCEEQGAGVILVDSISHEYDGPGGILEIVDRNANGRDNFAGWRVATPLHKRFIQRLCSTQAHLICTVRAKIAYDMRDVTDKHGNIKKKFEKVGLGPVQREGFEYEMDLFLWMENSTMTVDKTRSDAIEPLSVWPKPGADFAAALASWIEDSEPAKDNAPPVRAHDAADLTHALDEACIAGKAAVEAKDRAGWAKVRDGLSAVLHNLNVPREVGEKIMEHFKVRTLPPKGRDVGERNEGELQRLGSPPEGAS